MLGDDLLPDAGGGQRAADDRELSAHGCTAAISDSPDQRAAVLEGTGGGKFAHRANAAERAGGWGWEQVVGILTPPAMVFHPRTRETPAGGRCKGPGRWLPKKPPPRRANGE